MPGTIFPPPEPNESLERYTVRCAQLVKGRGMDPDEFNDSVWKMWHQYRGPTDEERVASQKFSPDRYTVVPGVCVFAEHETTTAKGEHRKYDLKELVKIVRGNNERISDVGAFPAIADGHTSNPDDPNPREPNIVGYAGNYRLGIIGRKTPRWAIFQDEYQMKDAAQTLRNKPRRSVELWTFKDGRAHFDPIAAIGAEAPRLPLPQRFSQFTYQDATVERYTFAGAYAAPAAGNTFVQSMGTMKKPIKTKQTYAAEPAGTAEPQSQGDQTMPRLAPEDVQQIIAAIAQTPQFDFLTKLTEAFESPDAMIQSIQGGGGMGGEMGGGLGGEDEFAGGEGLPPEGEQEDDLANIDDVLGGDTEPDTEPAAEPEPEPDTEGLPPEGANPEEEPLPEKRSMPKTNDATVEKYTQLQRSHQEALKDMSAMHTRIQLLERTNADHARRAKLAALHDKFPNFVDVTEEASRCLYSQKANLTDEQFEKHIADVERYAQKAQQASVYIPTGDAPKSEADTTSPEKYAMKQKINQRAVQIATAKRNKGEAIDYETAKQLAAQELAG